MRAVVQRVTRASVIIDRALFSSIGYGLCCLVGIERGDTDKDVNYIADKICGLRIFSNEDQKMNLSVSDVGGEILLISQFTLLGDARKGRRPSYILAESPDRANALFETLVDKVKEISPCRVTSGKFKAMMDVEIINQGPVTILLDSRRVF